ncbi:MAG: anti-sigma regulatory factor [Anaerolineae bacterium]|nr:anti-sigma regulatory factor [Anaerolineae bacterium]
MVVDLEGKTHVRIERDTDVVLACQKGRILAEASGFSGNDQAVIIVAISEIARNILEHAGKGTLTLSPLRADRRCGIEVTAEDDGPGIPDVNRALQDGYSTGAGLGIGLPGAKRLMDEFDLVSEVGNGTKVVMKKWQA